LRLCSFSFSFSMYRKCACHRELGKDRGALRIEGGCEVCRCPRVSKKAQEVSARVMASNEDRLEAWVLWWLAMAAGLRSKDGGEVRDVNCGSCGRGCGVNDLSFDLPLSKSPRNSITLHATSLKCRSARLYIAHSLYSNTPAFFNLAHHVEYCRQRGANKARATRYNKS
jgi:hypothetical protein